MALSHNHLNRIYLRQRISECHNLLAVTGSQRAGAQLLDLFCKIGSQLGKLAAHGRRYVKHLNALDFQADLFQQFPGVFHSSFGVVITFQVMAVSWQSASYHYTIHSIFQGV